jgi:hypothetical protein
MPAKIRFAHRPPAPAIPIAAPLAAKARILAAHLEQISLRKSRVLWELDMPLSRRCGELSRRAQAVALELEVLEEHGDCIAERFNLAAQLVEIETEAERIAPREPAPT